jgi:hypothetical protein
MNDEKLEKINLMKVTKQGSAISAVVSDDANLFELYGFMEIFMQDMADKLHAEFSDMEKDPYNV